MGSQVMSCNNKRMRVYSLETNKLLHLAFARNYVNHLVPALKKIKMNVERSTSTTTTPEDKDGGNSGSAVELAKIVRFEVDMAMALSAKEYYFAWSRALEVKLQTDIINGEIIVNQNYSSIHQSLPLKKETAVIVEEKAGESLTLVPHDHNIHTCNNVLVMKFPRINCSCSCTSSCSCSSTTSTSQNPRCGLIKIMKKSSKSKRRISWRKGQAKKSEEDIVKDRLDHLGMLLPGGTEMVGDSDEILTEVASYISCLKLQVKVLQCLVEA